MDIGIDFSGRHAMIFGGTSGINLGIAAAFARRGAKITVVSRKQENVDKACAHLSAIGPVHGTCADVRDYDAVGRAFASGVAAFGPVDALISGAAGNFLCEFNKMSANGFRSVLEIDLLGTFHVMRQAFDHLRRPGASVINVTAPQSIVPMRFQAHAGAAKAGIDQLTRTLALEWGAAGVRINAISPGPIEGTEGVRKLMASDEQERRASIAAVPLGRFGTLDDIANLALFLCSPFATYVSGAVIPCDGGGAIESVKPALEQAGRALAGRSL